MMILRAAVVWGIGLGLTGGATAGQYVDWFDDGSVLLKLGPDYDDAVIETSREQLGSLLGPDQAPFADTTITILTHDEGPKGPISGPITALRPVWEELTGGTLEIALVPIGELYAAMMLDLERGAGRYDAIVVPAYFL
jgi:hypothetical protein